MWIIIIAIAASLAVILGLYQYRRLRQKQAKARHQAEQGLLSANAVHDLNNMLGGISAAAEYIRAKLSADSELNRYVELIIGSCGRASRLAERILHPSLSEANQPTTDALIEVNDAINILKFRLRNDITLTLQNSSSRHIIAANLDTVYNLVINLVLNAQNAMPQGGEIAIMEDNVILPASTVPNMLISAPAGDYWHLSIQDHGSGISPADLPYIFTPFFTTNQSGFGTGLGLASVYNAIRSNHGGLGVETSSQGTTFHIYFPLAKKGTLPPSDTTKHLQQRFLLVDDDVILSAILQSILEQFGAQVTLCTDGASALKLLQTDLSAFDVIMLDILMPPPDGIEIYQSLRRLSPQLKIILTSGNQPDDTLRRFLSTDDKLSFLHKPYHSADVLDKVTSLLGKN